MRRRAFGSGSLSNQVQFLNWSGADPVGKAVDLQAEVAREFASTGRARRLASIRVKEAIMNRHEPRRLLAEAQGSGQVTSEQPSKGDQQ